MHRKIDARLAEWTDLYDQLKNVRAQLDGSDQIPLALTELRAERDRLEALCDEALKAVQAEFDALRRLDNPK